MPRFFFNTDDGMQPFQDEEGVELPNVDAVSCEVVALLRELVDVRQPHELQTVVATVCDITGATVLRSTMTVTNERYTG